MDFFLFLSFFFLVEVLLIYIVSGIQQSDSVYMFIYT